MVEGGRSGAGQILWRGICRAETGDNCQTSDFRRPWVGIGAAHAPLIRGVLTGDCGPHRDPLPVLPDPVRSDGCVTCERERG